MPHIAIISSSVRTARNSHRIALYFRQFIEKNNIATVEILDLAAYDFPIFHERLRLQENPATVTLEFAKKVTDADGILIVTPEYNGGYPAALKNVVDLLYAEWKRKPVAISTVSDGMFGGTQVITSLQFSLWKIGAWTVPAMYPVPNASKSFDENGVPTDEAGADKRATAFINELVWAMKAVEKMKQ